MNVHFARFTAALANAARNFTFRLDRNIQSQCLLPGVCSLSLFVGA
jgi:hypothetical protein